MRRRISRTPSARRAPDIYSEVIVGLRERKKLATRRRIVDAALHRFAERGYEATTVEEIAAEADVSVTTFFRYFRAKDEVLFVDADRWGPEFRTAIEERPANEPDLVAIYHALRVFHESGGDADDPRRLQRHKVVAETPVLRGRAYDVARRWQRDVAAVLAERQGVTPDAREPRLAAAVAYAIVSFADDEWSAHGGSVDWLTFLAEAFDCYTAIATGAV